MSFENEEAEYAYSTNFITRWARAVDTGRHLKDVDQMPCCLQFLSRRQQPNRISHIQGHWENKKALLYMAFPLR